MVLDLIVASRGIKLKQAINWEGEIAFPKVNVQASKKILRIHENNPTDNYLLLFG